MFYTIEGIDGAGCGVVRRALEKKLTEAKIKFTSLKYPVPVLPFGRDIYDHLSGKIKMNSTTQFIAFIGQMVEEKERLAKLRKDVLIVDRYAPCTLVFQGAMGFSIDLGLKLIKLFRLEKPDRIFYLKLPWTVAYERKNSEKRVSDINEANTALYKKTAQKYDFLYKKKILGPWTVIDATKTPEEEAEQIFQIIVKDKKSH